MPPLTTHDLAWKSNGGAFQEIVEPLRRELQVHCYRMLGSVQQAEDLVQETFLRAWHGRDQYDARASFRTWLYRIATNACLNSLARRRTARRLLPDAYGPPSEMSPGGRPGGRHDWLEPYPDSALEGVADTAPGPAARYELRESVQLAFIAAIQELPPRQRAVLLLRDVLGWSASETAHLLEGSQASVNSALQRARATLEVRFPRGQPSGLPATDLRQRALLERYVKAWESADPDGLVALVREDAVLRMPPNRAWYRGRAAIKAFFGWVWRPQGYGPFRLLTTAANSQPAFAAYVRDPLDATYRAHGIHVLTLADDRLSVLTIFRDPRLFQVFGLPAVLSADSVPVAGPRT